MQFFKRYHFLFSTFSFGNPFDRDNEYIKLDNKATEIIERSSTAK